MVGANGIGTITNQLGGSITGTGGSGIGISANNTISDLENQGTISGGSMGVSSGTIGTLNNSSTGLITGGAGGKGVQSATSINSLTNAGTISGGSYGIYAGDRGNITLNGGTVSGGIDAIDLNATSNAATSTVTVNGRATVTGAMVETNGIGVIALNLIGLTPADRTALQAFVGLSAGNFTDTMGDTYDWSGLILQGIGGGLASSVDSGLQPLATSIDTNGLPAGPQYVIFATAAATDPEAAVQSLSGRVIDEGFQDLKVNLNNEVLAEFDAQLDHLIGGTVNGGIDFGSLNIGTDQMVAYNNTNAQLSGLVRTAAMSDVAGTEMGVPPARSDIYKWGVWASGTVSFANEDQRGAQAGYHAVSGTPTIGVNYRINPNLRVGVLANYTIAGANFGDGSSIGVKSELFGVFAAFRQDAWRFHILAAGGVSQYDNQRSTLDGSTASSSPDGTDVLTDATGGYEFKLGDGYTITPQLGVQYTHIQKNATNETGSDLGLNVGSQEINSLRSHLGFILTRNFQIDSQLQFIPEFRAAWYHEYMDDNNGVNTSLQTGPSLGSFAVTSVNSPERNYGLIGVGLNTAFTGYGMPMGLFLNYDLQFGQSSYLQENVSGGLRAAF